MPGRDAFQVGVSPPRNSRRAPPPPPIWTELPQFVYTRRRVRISGGHLHAETCTCDSNYACANCVFMQIEGVAAEGVGQLVSVPAGDARPSAHRFSLLLLRTLPRPLTTSTIGKFAVDIYTHEKYNMSNSPHWQRSGKTLKILVFYF